MDTSTSIRHQFEVEIPGRKFVETISILKGEFTWKLEIMTLIPSRNFEVDSTFKFDKISMSSPRGFFSVFSTSNRCNFCNPCFHCVIP